MPLLHHFIIIFHVHLRLFMRHRKLNGEDVHKFVPEYRRIAEAEANWLKAQGKDKNRG